MEGPKNLPEKTPLVESDKLSSINVNDKNNCDIIAILTKPDTLNLIINVLIHALILFVILSVLFKFFISKIESNALNNEVKHHIDNLFTKVELPDEVIKPIQTLLKMDTKLIDRLKDKYDDTDELVRVNNEWLFRTLFIVVVLLVVGISIIIYILQLHYSINVKVILIENGITFAMVGVIEIVFFYYIILKFIPTKPSIMVNTFFSSIDKYLSPK